MQKTYDLALIKHIISNLPVDDYEQPSPDNPQKFNRLGLNEHGGYGFTQPKLNPDDYELIKDFNRDLRIQDRDINQWTPQLTTAGLLPEATDLKHKTKLLNRVMAMVLFPDQHLDQSHLEMIKPQMQALLRAYNQTVSASVFNALFVRAFNAFNLLFYDESTNRYFVEYICAIVQSTAVRNLVYNSARNRWELYYQATIEFRIRDSLQPTKDKLTSELIIDELATFSYTTQPSATQNLQYDLVPEQQNGFILQRMTITDLFSLVDSGPAVRKDCYVGFAGLFDAFLHWNKKQNPDFHAHLVQYVATPPYDRNALAPELTDLLLAPLNFYLHQVPAMDTTQTSAIDQLQRKIRKTPARDLAFPEVIALNRKPLYRYFDAVRPLLPPNDAEYLTFERVSPPKQPNPFVRAFLSPPSQNPGHHYEAPLVTEFIRQVVLQDRHKLFLLEQNGGYGLDNRGDSDAEPHFLKNIKDTNKLQGKTLSEWCEADKTLAHRIKIATDTDYNDIKLLVLEILEKKILPPYFSGKMCQQPQFGPPKNYQQLALVHFEILKRIYKQTVSKLTYSIMKNMMSDLQLPFHVEPIKKNDKQVRTYNIYYDSNEERWNFDSSAHYALYSTADPTETRDILASIIFEDTSRFYVPKLLDRVGLEPVKVIPELDQKGFQPFDLKISAPQQCLDWFAYYLHMHAYPTPGTRKAFLKHSFFVLNLLGLGTKFTFAQV